MNIRLIRWSKDNNIEQISVTCYNMCTIYVCPYGGIGRRDRFKICCLQKRTGSSPVRGTLFGRLVSSIFVFMNF